MTHITLSGGEIQGAYTAMLITLSMRFWSTTPFLRKGARIRKEDAPKMMEFPQESHAEALLINRCRDSGCQIYFSKICIFIIFSGKMQIYINKWFFFFFFFFPEVEFVRIFFYLKYRCCRIFFFSKPKIFKIVSVLALPPSNPIPHSIWNSTYINAESKSVSVFALPPSNLIPHSIWNSTYINAKNKSIWIQKLFHNNCFLT